MQQKTLAEYFKEINRKKGVMTIRTPDEGKLAEYEEKKREAINLLQTSR